MALWVSAMQQTRIQQPQRVDGVQRAAVRLCNVSVQLCEQRFGFVAWLAWLASVLRPLANPGTLLDLSYWGLWPPSFITFILVFLFVLYFWVL